MNAFVDAAVARLNQQVPLALRQRELPEEVAGLHRAILRLLYEKGRTPTREEARELLSGTGVDEAFVRLGDADLAVLSADRREVVGAYPMTTEKTPHRLLLEGRSVYAMCAVDAVSVTPMFGGPVEIHSVCRVTGDRVLVRQRDREILEAAPEGGVLWLAPCSRHAAHSMCMEMVFLQDDAVAREWTQGESSVFTLPEAVEFGADFITPLL